MSNTDKIFVNFKNKYPNENNSLLTMASHIFMQNAHNNDLKPNQLMKFSYDIAKQMQHRDRIIKEGKGIRKKKGRGVGPSIPQITPNDIFHEYDVTVRGLIRAYRNGIISKSEVKRMINQLFTTLLNKIQRLRNITEGSRIMYILQLQEEVERVMYNIDTTILN